MSNFEIIKNSYKESKRERIMNEEKTKPPKKKPVVPVKLVHIDLPFWNMVNFMVTAAIAAIPAIIILFLLGMALMAVVGGIGGMGR